jgi:hypothetical protein
MSSALRVQNKPDTLAVCQRVSQRDALSDRPNTEPETAMTPAALPTLTLGRDGLGADADEDAFQNWAAFVAENIDETAGFPVYVAIRPRRGGGAQSDSVTDATDEQRAAVIDAKQTLWLAWCAAGAPAGAIQP